VEVQGAFPKKGDIPSVLAGVDSLYHRVVERCFIRRAVYVSVGVRQQ